MEEDPEPPVTQVEGSFLSRLEETVSVQEPDFEDLHELVDVLRPADTPCVPSDDRGRAFR